MKEGREYQGCGEEYNVKKGKGNNIICSMVLGLLGRILYGEEGNVTEIFGKKIKI